MTPILNTELRVRGKRGITRYVIDQDPKVAQTLVARAGPGVIHIQDRRDGCVAVIWRSEFVSAAATSDAPSTPISTLVAMSRARNA